MMFDFLQGDAGEPGIPGEVAKAGDPVSIR